MKSLLEKFGIEEINPGLQRFRLRDRQREYRHFGCGNRQGFRQ